MVVGQGRAGKTSTVRRLLGRGFDEKEASTLGVQTEQQFSVDLSRTVNGFVEVDPEKEDFVRRQVGKVARSRYHNNGKPMHEKGQTQALKLPAFHEEIAQEQRVAQATYEERTESVVGSLSSQLRDNRESAQSKSLSDSEEEKEVDLARRYSESIFGTIMQGEEETTVQLTIWDYGGQRVFYALHHLFLTEFGVYMLVFDMREVLNQEDKAVEYLQFWLRSIALHAPSAPIVLVGTYADKVTTKSEWKHINEVLEDRVHVVKKHNRQLVANEENGLAFFPVDNWNGVGLVDVQESILVALNDREFMSYPVPLSWLSCLDQLVRKEIRTVDYLSVAEVGAVARKHGVKVSEVRLMLSFFHEIGSLFYFQRSNDLRNMVILNPQWLVDALTCLIFDNDVHAGSVWEVRRSLRPDEKLFLTRGILSRRLRQAKWNAKKFSPHIQKKLLALMEHMLLVCKWPWHYEDGAYIVPSMLLSKKNLHARAEREVAEKIQRYDGPRCEIDFSESYLPDGLFQRLVCMCASYAELFADDAEDPPIVRGRAAIIEFGVEVVFGMQCMVAEQKIMVAVKADSSPGAAPRLVKLLNSMLKALRDDFMGRNLVWQLKLNSAAKPGLFVDYKKLEKERKSKKRVLRYEHNLHQVADFDQWFLVDGTESLGSLVEEDTTDLVTSEGKAKEFGILAALKQVVTKPKDIPEGQRYHCFISYKQDGGSEIAVTLFLLLAIAGYKPWYDMAQEEINVQSMFDGVRDAAVYVLVLSKDVFKSKAVLNEFRQAKKLKKPVVVIYENDTTKKGYCSFGEYMETIPSDLARVFDEEEAVKFERRFYLLSGIMLEIKRRLQKRLER